MLAGVVPFLACTKLKAMFKYDDALDTFGVHAVGGTLGALLTGFLATADVNANLNTNLAGARRQRPRGSSSSRPSASRWRWPIVGTVVIAMIVKAIIGLRPTVEDEEAGLDETDHGEAGYHHDEAAG